jgi:2-C-methyl-D-erythritol 2,4-cyclodiphosphate synthase
MTRFRTGIGHDVHRLFPDHELVLGVAVSTEVGFNTHSDGDVLSHALIDALAGAIADGDLGTHYPEDDPDAEDARSLEFVKEFAQYVRPAGYEIEDVDAFVVLGIVRLRPHIDAMRRTSRRRSRSTGEGVREDNRTERTLLGRSSVPAVPPP